MARHIKRARKPWACAACRMPIEPGTRHFCLLGSSLPYGRFITAMVEARYHLTCLAGVEPCCIEARTELDAILHPPK